MDFYVDKDFAILYGIMLGDGCLSLVNKKDRIAKAKFVSITGSSDDDLPFFENIISPILTKFRGRNTTIKFRKSCKAIDFNFTDSKLFDVIHSFGFPIGKKENKLSIPKVFYDKKLVEFVIAGFFATDGSLVLTKNPNKYYPRIESRVISCNLLKQIYDYLISIGLNGAFYESKSKPYFKWKNPQKAYRVQFNGLKNLVLFEKKIGFINPKYQEKFEEFLKYDKEYTASTLHIPSWKINNIYAKLNKNFEERMAAPRFELGTPALPKTR